jgi:hypothetical protein
MASARGITLRELYVSLAAVGGLLLLLGVVGGLLKERTPISEPLIALLAGVLIGPAALGLLDLAELGRRRGNLGNRAASGCLAGGRKADFHVASGHSAIDRANHGRDVALNTRPACRSEYDDCDAPRTEVLLVP